ncbi:MAG: 3'(2'),5'-bisphosphate nucleotidase CysQ [Bacteroidetes bacterium]|nr:3'(2'),5'-bisphosphate nucleotidase CysQ [Bacteroidota bacterium]
MYSINLAKQVADIAQKAGEAILNIYNHVSDIEIQQKSDSSPLTLADRKANEIICEGLEKLETQFPIVSEENKAIPYDERKNYDYHWLVDPLDGTKEFIKRNGEFTVNIALIHQQKPVLGVVYAPCLDEMYWAVKEEGAYLQKEEKVQKIKAKPFQLTDEGLHVVCSRSHLNEGTKAFIDKLNEPELVSQGSSLKFLIIAKGEAHCYPRLAPTMEWDTGAAQIILEEAGGSVINNETQQPLQYNKENLLNPHFVAYGDLT